MTREEIINTLHKCAIGECQDCDIKDFRDCTSHLKLAAAAMLEDDTVDDTAEKREWWEAHGRCNDGCIHYEEDERTDPNCICNKCLGTVPWSEQNWEREDCYTIDTNESEIPTSCEVPNNSDAVHHPSHYTNGGIECIEAIKASMSKDGFADYCKGNVLKYLWRWRDKGGVEDLKKARVYLDWLIEVES